MNSAIRNPLSAIVTEDRAAWGSRNQLLEEIQNRVLWLAIQMVHYANKGRPNPDGEKIGGHQASSASVVTILTYLFFEYLRPGDKIAIKPHASPVYHAIQFLLGNLEPHYLNKLRAFHGLQSYPSRTKDPDDVDFATGSMGLGAVAPNFAAMVEAYARSHFWPEDAPGHRWISLVGDAELDEGVVWEAIAEPALSDLENVLWIVDINRQSLDRVIPGIRVDCWRQMFRANGWRVIEAKFGKHLQAAFREPRGQLLQQCIDELSNEAYQRLLRLPPAQLRDWLPRKSSCPQEMEQLLSRWDDDQLHQLFGNLGGHDFDELRDAFAQADLQKGPAVIFAYTLKGWMLPTVGHPQNHSALLTPQQLEELRRTLRIPEDQLWEPFQPSSKPGQLCGQARRRLQPGVKTGSRSAPLAIPFSLEGAYAGGLSTQQIFGSILMAITRQLPAVSERIVTISPDVASSTNLGGWINKMHVWNRKLRELLPEETQPGALKWEETLQGRHIELGISENNLFMALGQLGLSQEMLGELLLPIGTLYDCFVGRGLDAFYYGLYSGAKFIVVGTPSGVTLAPEGGAHQSLYTESIGIELPGLAFYEPCFGQELEWILLSALAKIQQREESTYLRLTSKLVNQNLFNLPSNAQERQRLRELVLRGAYRLVDRRSEPGYQPGKNVAHLFACGAMIPEACQASQRLREQGIFANVINVTGPGPLYREFHGSIQTALTHNQEPTHLLFELIPAAERRVPVITIVDSHPHALAWIGTVLGTTTYPLGVAGFGQSGTRTDLYREYRIDLESIIETARYAVKTDPRRP